MAIYINDGLHHANLAKLSQLSKQKSCVLLAALLSVALPYPAVRFPPSKMGALSAISVRESGSKEGSVEKLWGQYAKAITLKARFRWMRYSDQHKILPMPSFRIVVDHTQSLTVSLSPSSLMYWSQRDNKFV